MRKPFVSRREFLGATSAGLATAGCCMLCRQSLAAESGTPGQARKAVYYSACGIYCGGCPTLIESEKADTPEKVKCLGCLSEKISPEEAKCDLRLCAKERSIQACSLCKDYPCEKTKKFFAETNVWKVEMAKNLGIIKQKGLAKWLEEQKVRWTCPKCGRRASYCDKKCGNCGTKLNPVG